METLLLNPYKNPSAIKKAAEILINGGVVALPTETVYGLAANALDIKAIHKIFEAKGRPQDNPLIVHVSKLCDVFPLVLDIPNEFFALADAFWPGPLTIILKKSDVIPDTVSAGLDTVAIRIPSHPIMQAILKESKLPLAAPSANISGLPSPTSFNHVYDDLFGRIDAIIDGGDSNIGLESTVLSLANKEPLLLRPGKITLSQLEDIIGKVQISNAVLNPLNQNEVAASPGMKHRHYSPKANITIVKGDIEQFLNYVKNNEKENLAVLCFDGEEKLFDCPCVSMGKFDDPISQAQNLFNALRKFDEIGAKNVYARHPNAKGLGLAVCNRLYRAANFNIIEV